MGGAPGGGAAEGAGGHGKGPDGGGVPWVTFCRGAGVAIAIVKNMFFMPDREFFGLAVFLCDTISVVCVCVSPFGQRPLVSLMRAALRA